MMMMGHGCCSNGGGHLGSVLLALTAVLGYWALQQSSKDSGSVRRAGQAVGWVLVVVGLLGFLCGAAGHARKMGGAANRRCVTREHVTTSMEIPPGHPPIDGEDTKVEVKVIKKKGS